MTDLRYDKLDDQAIMKVIAAVANNQQFGALQKVDRYEDVSYYYYIRYQKGKVALRYNEPFARIEILLPAPGQDVDEAPIIGLGNVGEDGKIDFQFLEKWIEQ